MTMTLRQSQRLAIGILGLLIGALLLIFVVVLPAIKRIVTLSKVITQERLRIERTLAPTLKLKKTVSDLARLESVLPKLRQMKINPGQELKLIAELERHASALKISQILEVTESNADKNLNNKLKNVTLNLRLKGKFPELLKYLETLERNPALFPIEFITFRVPDESALKTKAAPPEDPILETLVRTGFFITP